MSAATPADPPLILIVDDQARARLTIEALLAVDGYALAFASEGGEALALARAIHPDLILLDVMMPGLDGFEVCRRLRADPQLELVPIIMVTALADQSALLDGFAAGVDDFIHKPFNGHELRARVRTTTRLNRYRRLIAEQARALDEHERFRWATADAHDGYLTLAPDDRVLSANMAARRYLGLPDDIGLPTAEPFLGLAAHAYMLTPADVWAGWPGPGDGAAPRYLLRPESEAVAELWLQVERRAGTGVGESTLRLQDVTAEMKMYRDMWTFQNLAAHKLRTPLVGLLGALQLLQRGEQPAADGEQSMLDVALQSAQRLHQTVEDILGFHASSRLHLAGPPLALADLPAVVAKIGADLAVGRLAVLPADDLPAGLIGLPRQRVESIVLELIENSVKFHPRGAPAISATVARGPSGGALLSIADDGVTLTPEQLAWATTPYYQGEKYFTGQISGTGLGLAGVARTVWGCGGHFQIANRSPGPGVIVTLHLPLTYEA